MYLPRPRSLRAWAAVAAVALLLVVAAAVTWTSRSAPAVATEDVQFALPEGPGSADQVNLDARLYVPEQTPAPAVLLAHGFGGSKDSVAAPGSRSRRGRLRGAGLQRPRFRAQHRADLVERPGPGGRGCPRHGGLAGGPHRGPPGRPAAIRGWASTGGSYGGALALTLGGTDQRIDAIAASITWNDLGQALFPNFGTPGPVCAHHTRRRRVRRTRCAQAGLGRHLLRGRRGRCVGCGRGRPRPVPGRAAGSSPPSARPTPRPPRPAAPARNCWPCSPRTPPPPSSAPSPRPRCWSRANRTPCSGWTRPTRTPGRSRRRAPPSRSAGFPAATTPVATPRPASARWPPSCPTASATASPTHGSSSPCPAHRRTRVHRRSAG